MTGTNGTLTVEREDPREAAAPSFANFIGISHVGTEVQFEFVFLDLGQLAQQIEQFKAKGTAVADDAGNMVLRGKTVGKIIVPISSFVQIKDHLLAIFEKLESLNEPQREETGSEREYGN